jgi:GTP-binding protein
MLVRDLEKVIVATRAAIAKRPVAHPDLIVTSAQKGDGMPALRAEIARLLAS